MSRKQGPLLAALTATFLLTAVLHSQEAAPSRIVKEGSILSSLRVMANEVYFSDFTYEVGTGNRTNTLYRSDGTPEGTTSLSVICVNNVMCDGEEIHGIWGSTLYFRVWNPLPQDQELWAVKPGSQPQFLLSFDAFSSGAHRFRELSPGLLAFQVGSLFDPLNQIYTTDGTAAGTQRRDDGTPSTASSNASYANFVWQGSYVYQNFNGNLVETPANPAGPIPYLNPLSRPSPVVTIGEHLLYQVENSQPFWYSELRSITRQELDGITLASSISSFSSFATFGSHSLIRYEDKALLTDGTRNGTFGLPKLTRDGWPSEYARLGQRIAYVDDEGWLAFSDLTERGTYEVLSPQQGPFSEMTPVGDHIFLRQGPSGQLGVTDGTVAGSSLINLEPGSQPTRFLSIDDRRVVFAATTAAHGEEPWISDGTPEGTYRLDDVVPGPASSIPHSFTVVGSRLFFVVERPEGGEELRVLDLPSARPACPADRLCLLDGRFEVAVRAVASGQEFPGKRAFGISESGVFSFFSPNNWEFLVKVLDGCAINNHFWVYASAATDVAYELEVKDRASGQTKTYSSDGGAAARPILDGRAFSSCGLEAPPTTYSLPEPLAEDARRCPDDFTELCLSDRFRVKAEWQTGTGSGKALPVATGSADSGLFTFFSPSNWELMVKVLDGCDINNRHWVFAAGTTDVAWTLTVKDQTTGETKVYTNALGNASRTITDSDALGGCS